MDEGTSTATEASSRRVNTLRALGILSFVLIGSALIYQSLLDTSTNCYSLMSNGQWVSNRWYPYRCIIERYPSKSYFQNAITQSYVVFIGDKSLLDYYSVLAEMVSDHDPVTLPSDLEKNFPLTYSTPDKTYTSDYVWSGKLDQTVFEYYQSLLKTPIKSLPTIIIHQHLQYEVKGNDQTNSSPLTSCTDLISQLMTLQTNYMTSYNKLVGNTTGLDPTIVMLLYDVSTLSDVSRQCQQVLEDMYTQAVQKQHLWSQNLVILHLESSYDAIKHQGLEVLLHFICNSSQYSTCCFSSTKSNYESLIVPILFVLLALYIGLVFVRATGTLIPLEPYFEGASIDLDHVYSIIHLFGIIVISLFYSSSIDKLEYFVIASPVRSHLLFALLLIAIVCLGFMKRDIIGEAWQLSTLMSKEITKIISKDHVYEWRGWSVMVLVALEYSNIAETDIGSWLWILMISHLACISGYSHFVSFWDSRDFTLKTLLKKIFRQNYLTIWLCVALHSTYGLYIIPSIMTQVLLTVYITMATILRLSPASNEGKSKVVIAKLFFALLVAVILTAVEMVVDPQPPTSFILKLDTVLRNGQLWTTPYVVRIMSFLGMGIAYYCKTNQTFLSTLSTDLLKGLFVALSFVSYASFVAVSNVTGTSQIIHLLLSSMTILAYLFIRNWTIQLNLVYSFIFKHFGYMSIEFYVLFQHVMLSNKTKGIVYLFPSYYSLNMLATLIVLLYLSMSMRKFSKKVTEERASMKVNEEETAQRF